LKLSADHYPESGGNRGKKPCPEHTKLVEGIKAMTLSPSEYFTAKFPLGTLIMTRGVNDKASKDIKFAKFITDSLKRHAKGDWGDLTQEDKNENELSLKAGFRLLSAYQREGLPKIWIITEADRSATTILFPEEY
jgi:hypothetical protein